MWWLLLIIPFGAALFGYIWLRRAGGGRFPWFKFYSKGREAGFSYKEINMLRRVAVENQLRNPTSLFWSIKQLDRSIKGMIIKFKSEGVYEMEQNALFVAKLFDFRHSVEMNLPKYKLGLNSTRKIVTHQRLKITLPGQGVYIAQVVENLRKYMAVSYPEGPSLPQGFSWAGQKVNVYFWRQDDAGYVFQTKVMEDYLDKKFPILHIAHNDSITRSQKRNSVRVDTNVPAKIYPLKRIDQANDVIEKTPGLRSRLVNLSETGAALLVGGRAKVGMPIKIQFALAGKEVVFCGVTKGVSYDSKRNHSILHIQGLPLKPLIKNQVLSFVYNIFEEREKKPKESRVPKYK